MFVGGACAQAGENKSTFSDSVPCINADIQNNLLASDNVWSYNSSVEYDVIGTEVKRVYRVVKMHKPIWRQRISLFPRSVRVWSYT